MRLWLAALALALLTILTACGSPAGGGTDGDGGTGHLRAGCAEVVCPGHTLHRGLRGPAEPERLLQPAGIAIFASPRSRRVQRGTVQ